LATLNYGWSRGNFCVLGKGFKLENLFNYEVVEVHEKGKHFGHIVRWFDTGKSKSSFIGTVEGQVGSQLKIFVFDMNRHGSRRTVKEVSSVEFLS
tara:strand:- start:834 stop:1118 length:285 start_codon:yes stop_codon:yes gene_type:complete